MITPGPTFGRSEKFVCVTFCPLTIDINYRGQEITNVKTLREDTRMNQVLRRQICLEFVFALYVFRVFSD